MMFNMRWEVANWNEEYLFIREYLFSNLTNNSHGLSEQHTNLSAR